MRRGWEQTRKKEGAADWGKPGKGQLPLQHFSLINRGKQ